MFDRLEIENSILGAIIFCNGYMQVAHVLSPANFSSLPGVENRGLYSVITGLFPDRPIDFLTIAQEIRSKYPQDVTLMSTLLNTGQRVGSASNISHWAILLLQEDISIKFQNNLAEWRAERIGNLDHAETGALLEILENVRAGEDIFSVIDGAILYFQHLNMEKEFQLTIQFYQDLNTKVRQIKKMNSINTALRYLYQATEADDIAQQHCKIFADAIASILINQKIDPKYTEAANLINQ